MSFVPKTGAEALRRLKKLKKIAIKASEEMRLDMSDWGTHRGDHSPEEDNFCGTTCCVLGWAALDPQFKRLGLQSRWSHDGYTSRLIIGVDPNVSHERYACKFFGISETQAGGIFYSASFSVLERIDRAIQSVEREMLYDPSWQPPVG